MSNDELTYAHQGRLSNKKIYRDKFNHPLRKNIQTNMGRVQQVGKESYRRKFCAQGEDSKGAMLSVEWITEPSSDYHRTARLMYITLNKNVHHCSPQSTQPATQLVEPEKRAGEFVERARRLDTFGKTDTALDIIYDNIDSLLTEGKYGEVDSILRSADIEGLSVDMLLGLLTSTLPAKTELSSRHEFFLDVEKGINQRKEWEDGLLTGLES